MKRTKMKMFKGRRVVIKRGRVPRCKGCGDSDAMIRTDLWTCLRCGVSQ
jgi:ribosomal protein L37AE/L43A